MNMVVCPLCGMPWEVKVPSPVCPWCCENTGMLLNIKSGNDCEENFEEDE